MTIYQFHGQIRLIPTIHRINESTAIADVEKQTDALQIAYSMGGMSIKAYRMTESNPNYDSDAKESEKSEISLGLAF